MKKTSGFFLAPIFAFLLSGTPILSAFAESVSVTVNAQASVGPTLQITLSEGGSSELRFGNIRPSAVDTTQAGPITVKIKVDCNTGEKYQVTQALNDSLMNAQGDQISAEQLTFKSSGTTTSGTGIPDFLPSSSSSQVIFVSDNKGTGDTVSAEYSLLVPPGQAPGDYSAFVTYTASVV